MSYHLIDFSNKNPDFNFDNMIIGRKIANQSNESMKYYIYYNEPNSEQNSPKELYIRLPKLRLIYGMGNNKYNMIKIPIYPNWDVTNNFIEFIKNLETMIEECFNNKKITKEFSSLISKKNNIFFIKTNLTDNVKITSQDIPSLDMNDFKINGMIEMVIKVSYVWVNGEKMGLSSQLHQIKYYPPPEQIQYDFIDMKPQIQKSLIIKPQIIIEPKVLEEQSSSAKFIQQNLPPQIKIIPSVGDLKNAIKSLKSINNT